MTVTELAKQALRLGSLVDAESTPSANELTRAREALNALLYRWSTSPQGVYRVTRESHTLTASDGEYSIGASADIDTTRPTRIVAAFVRNGNTDYRVEIIGHEDYARIPDKTVSSIPARLYYEPAYATGTILLYPLPDAAYVLHLHSHKPLAQYTDNTDALGLPPEYEDALKWNLHVDLCGEYGKEPSAVAVQRALESYALLKRLHAQPVPTARPFGGGRTYDITGDIYL